MVTITVNYSQSFSFGKLTSGHKIAVLRDEITLKVPRGEWIVSPVRPASVNSVCYAEFVLFRNCIESNKSVNITDFISLTK